MGGGVGDVGQGGNLLAQNLAIGGDVLGAMAENVEGYVNGSNPDFVYYRPATKN